MNVDAVIAYVADVPRVTCRTVGVTEVLFRVLDIKLNECLQEARYSTPAVPTELQLIDDISYAVANHITTAGACQLCT